MQTINNRMTETQIADLFSLAVQLQVKAEESDDRDTAILAYSIQNACSNLTESQREFRAADATIHNLELKITDMAVQLANAESKCRALAVENVGMKDGVTYFACGAEYGFDLFSDKQAAIDTAQEEIELHRESYLDGSGSWDKGVERAAWGIVIQSAQRISTAGYQVSGSQLAEQDCDYRLEYLQGHKDGLEWSAQLAEANHPQTGDWLYDDPIELARAIRKGQDMPTAQDGNSPVTPDGLALVPKRLTAENGAKGVLSGEFSETKFINCPECFGDDECETCDGSGRIEITVPVTWTTIKAIWAKGVEHFAAAPQQEVKSALEHGMHRYAGAMQKLSEGDK